MGLSHRDVLDKNRSIIAEILDVTSSKGGSQVGDDCVWQTKTMEDLFEEVSGFFRRADNERIVLNPFGELVNGNIYPPETT